MNGMASNSLLGRVVESAEAITLDFAQNWLFSVKDGWQPADLGEAEGFEALLEECGMNASHAFRSTEQMNGMVKQVTIYNKRIEMKHIHDRAARYPIADRHQYPDFLVLFQLGNMAFRILVPHLPDLVSLLQANFFNIGENAPTKP